MSSGIAMVGTTNIQTLYIQTLIDQAAPGSTVTVPPGTYAVDTVNPITLKSDITLDLTDVVLTAIPTANIFSVIVAINGCNNVTIIRGTIIGERDTHLGPIIWSAGGGGGGIAIAAGSRNIKIDHTIITGCFADGILALSGSGIEITGVVCNHNRRSGMSVINCDGLHVTNSQFSNSGGTPPGCGIDLECDFETERISNVLIEKSVFYDNAGACVSFGSPGKYINCRVAADNSFDMKTQPIVAAGNAAPLGTVWWAFVLNRTLGWTSGYRWWGYRTEWYRA